MRIISFTLILVLSNLSFCKSIIEKRLEKNFYKMENKISSKTDGSVYEILGLGYLNGYIFFDDKTGFRHFAIIPKDIEKSKLYLSKADEKGKELSSALLGIILRRDSKNEKELDKSIDYLLKVKDKFYDVSGEYGLALHQKLRRNKQNLNKENIQEMISHLNLAAYRGYLPALNALGQIYSEGFFVKKDIKKSEIYTKEATRLAKNKIEKHKKISKAIDDSRQRLKEYSKLSKEESRKGKMLSFIASLGLIASVSFSYSSQNFSSICTVGCSPPSVIDLLNWGIL